MPKSEYVARGALDVRNSGQQQSLRPASQLQSHECKLENCRAVMFRLNPERRSRLFVTDSHLERMANVVVGHVSTRSGVAGCAVAVTACAARDRVVPPTLPCVSANDHFWPKSKPATVTPTLSALLLFLSAPPPPPPGPTSFFACLYLNKGRLSLPRVYLSRTAAPSGMRLS